LQKYVVKVNLVTNRYALVYSLKAEINAQSTTIIVE